MKTVRIKYRDMMDLDAIASEFIIKQTLRSADFDLSKPISWYEDFGNMEKVYFQLDNEDIKKE